MFCVKCGNNVPEGASFCNKCGASTVRVAANNTVESAVSEAVSFEPQQPVAYPVPETENSHGESAVSQPVQSANYDGLTHNPVITKPTGDSGNNGSEKIKASKPKSKQTVSQVLISVLICFFILIFMFVTFGLLTVREAASADNLRKIPERIDPVKVLDIMDNNDIEVGDENDIRRVYQKMEITGYIGDKLAMVSDYIFGDGELEEIDTEAVYDMIVAEKDILYEKAGYNLETDEIKEFLDETGDEIFYNLSSEQGKYAGIYKNIGIFASTWIIIILILIQLALIVLLFKVQKWNWRALIWTSSAFILSSLIYMVIIGAFGANIVSAFLPANELLNDVVKVIMDSVFWNVIKIGAFALVIGVILMTVYFIIRKIKKSSKGKVVA